MDEKHKAKLAELRGLKPDEPLSVIDGAPPVITLDCGARARIIGGMDLRVASKIVDKIPGLDQEDFSLILLFCVLHTTPAEIAKLWKLSQKPEKFHGEFLNWFAAASSDMITSALQELLQYESELAEEVELSSGNQVGDDGKKKTT
jgi:hypothetical protein